MPSTNLFKVYSSSAGSGKTFTLAIEYIKLILSTNDPFYFRKILAVTFTNDAANEMKIRILEYLETLAYSKADNIQLLKKKEFLTKIILNEISPLQPEISEKVIEIRAGEAFLSIIHHYSDFSVSTIDSFIQKIIGAFAMQLGYMNNMEIVLDAEEILLPAAENFIAKVGAQTESTLTEAIVEYVGQLADDGKSWNNLPQSFADFAKNLFSDSKLKYLEKIENLTLESLRVISLQLFEYQKNTETELIDLANKFVSLCKANNLQTSDFFQSGKGILAAFGKKAKQIDLFKEFNSYVQKTKTENKWYTGKSDSGFIIDTIKSELAEILEDYEAILEAETKKYNLLKAISKNIFKLSLLRQFKVEIEQIKNESGQVHISEFIKAILNVVASEPVPYIYERIGEKYNHIMIDEFQDTSPIQFHNFLPLFDNSLANNHLCLVVGDPKQAIYRFRGGDMTQIIHLYNKNIKALKRDLPPDSFLQDNLDQIEPHLIGKSLKVNYRSCAEIIDFNNDIFGFIRNYEPFQNEFPLLDNAFDDSYFQEKPAGVASGAHIQIIFRNEVVTEAANFEQVDESEKNEAENTENKLKWEDPNILKTVKNCLSDGFDFADMAILCRKKEVAKVLANYLKTNGIPVVSADSILLSSSNSVVFIMDLLSLMTDNTSFVRHQCLIHFHLFILKENLPENTQNIKQVLEKEQVVSIIDYFNSYGYELNLALISSFSLYELVEYFINVFKLLENKAEQEYIYAFLDEVISFKAKKSENIGLFIKFWEINKNRLAIVVKEANAVTITTIHKSKGLQYPVVLVPEAQWGFQFTNFDTIWVHLDEVNDDHLCDKSTHQSLRAASLSPNKSLLNTAISSQYKAEQELYFLEAINMLYVALTRAEARLYIFTNHGISDKKAKELDAKKQQGIDAAIQNVGQIFYHYLKNKGVYENDKFEYILSEGKSHFSNKKETTSQSFLAVSPISYQLENSLQLKATQGFAQTINGGNATEQGNKIHEILAEIYTNDDIEVIVNKAFMQGKIDETEANEITLKLQKLVSMPSMQPCFEKGAKVKNEMEILLPDGTSLRPDRVIFFKNKTQIIDYKTGIELPEYHSKLRVYGNLLQTMGHPKAEMKLVYLEHLKIVDV